MRWEVPLQPRDIEKFKTEFLLPALENIADDYEWWAWCLVTTKSAYDAKERAAEFPHHYPRHYRMPFGVRSSLQEGGTTDMDTYLENGSTVGLSYSDNLFPEL